MKCPKCGNELSFVETIDLEFFDNSYIDHCEGECLRCKTVYLWKEYFVFESASDLRESE